MSAPQLPPMATPLEGRLQLAVVAILMGLLGVQIWQSAGHRWQPNPIELGGSSEPATAPDPDLRLDVNAASAADLEHLPGVGKRRAAAIVADRQERGPFASVAELDRVYGIGPATVKLMSPYVRVSAATQRPVVELPTRPTPMPPAAPVPKAAPAKPSEPTRPILPTKPTIPAAGGGTLAAPPSEAPPDDPVPGTVLRKPRGSRAKKPTTGTTP